MNKRMRKKRIPQGTIYCGKCPWHKFVKVTKLDETNCEHASTCEDYGECWTTASTSCRHVVYRCQYLKYTDYKQDSLLWDGCKECGEREQYTFKQNKAVRTWLYGDKVPKRSTKDGVDSD